MDLLKAAQESVRHTKGALGAAHRIVRDFVQRLLQRRLAQLYDHLQSHLSLPLGMPFNLVVDGPSHGNRIILEMGTIRLAEIQPLIDRLRVARLDHQAGGCVSIPYQRDHRAVLQALRDQLWAGAAAFLADSLASLPSLAETKLSSCTAILSEALGDPNGLHLALPRIPKCFIALVPAAGSETVTLAVKTVELGPAAGAIKCGREDFASISRQDLLSILYAIITVPPKDSLHPS